MKHKFLSFFLIVLIAIAFLNVLPLVYASIFSDGFETEDFTAWDGVAGSPTVQDGVVHSGSWAMLSDGANAEYCYVDFAEGTPRYVRSYVYIDVLPPTSTNYVGLLEPYDVSMSRYIRVEIINNSGTVVWAIYDSATSATSYSATTPLINTWYCVEIKHEDNVVDIGDILYVDGENILERTSSNFVADRLYLGGWDKSSSENVYQDDVVIDSSYIGPIAGGPTAYTVDLTETFTIGLTKAEQMAYHVILDEATTLGLLFTSLSNYNLILTQGTTLGLNSFSQLVYYVTLSLTANLGLLQYFQTTYNVILTAGINPILTTLLHTAFNLVLSSTWTTGLISYAVNASAVINHFIVDLALNIVSTLLNPIEIATSIGSVFALAALALIIALSAFGAIFLIRRRRND